jgi:hypothetical protein
MYGHLYTKASLLNAFSLGSCQVFHHRENEEGGGYDAAAQSPTTMESRTIASFANGPIGRVIPSAVDVEREGLFSAIGGTKKSGGYRSFEQIN